MKSTSIRQRIGFGFAAITLIALAFGSFAVFRLSMIRADTDRILQNTLPAMARAGDLAIKVQSLGDKSSVLFLKAILSPSDDLRADFALQIQTNLTVTEKLAGDFEHELSSAEEKSVFAGFQAAFQSYRKIFTDGLQLCSDGKNQAAMELKEGKLEPALAALLQNVNALAAASQNLGEQSGKKIQSTVALTQAAVWSGLAGLFLAAIVISFVIILTTAKTLKEVTSSLEEVAGGILHAGDQVADSSEAVAHNAGEQAASIHEVNKSLGRMIVISQSNARHSREAATIARETCAAAETGSKNMTELHSAVQEINASSDDIGKIVKTIDEIAFQTNLLALNAAVEAARAGEAGLGFAVVADEVRNLAQRCAHAAKETSNRIDGSRARAARGAELGQRLKENFMGILANARKADRLDEAVCLVSQEQAQGVTEIERLVNRLAEVTEANAASAEQSASTAQDLSGRTAQLNSAIGNLSRLVGGEGGAISIPEMAPAESGSRFELDDRPQHSRNGVGPTRTIRPEHVLTDAPVE
jgi:methyl-accepting chemotaxis protein